MSQPNAIVIGGGFAGLSSSAHLTRKGYQVTLLEKNAQVGGRASQYTEAGFTFDMGPSWYWMPDVFEKFFEAFQKKPSDYYELKRLDPSYKIYQRGTEELKIPAEFSALQRLFDKIEAGSGARLAEFMEDARVKYELGMGRFAYKPSRSWLEFMDPSLLSVAPKLNLLSSFSKHVRKFFKDERLVQLMEFPVLFLGTAPQKTPAMYSLMNYADTMLGTWYPMGGMYSVVQGMAQLATQHGVKIHTEESVKGFTWGNGEIYEVLTDKATYKADVVVGACDYHHMEQLLPKDKRTYSKKYWESRVMAPSCLIYYLGVDDTLEELEHHNLFFDTSFADHAHDIYNDPSWPKAPQFYVSRPSKTDPTVAPKGKENLFALIPVAAGLEDTEEVREHYYNMIMERLEARTGKNIRDKVIVKRSYAFSNFVEDYHAFKGNAYGLANTLNQTAMLKPSVKSKKVNNLYYAGQLTVPGPGVPPAIISGQIVAELISKELNHESTI